MKKILYHSVHEVLEYDDIRMLRAAGCSVYSIGAYATPKPDGTDFRGAIDDSFLAEEFEALVASGSYVRGAEVKLTPAFVERFDAVIFNQSAPVIMANLDACRNVPVIYRTIGQSSLESERAIATVADRLHVVRYSEHEAHPDFPPAEAVIRFGKFVDEYPPWTGGGTPLTFMNFIARGVARPTLAQYQAMIEGTRARLYGANNAEIPNWAGLAPHAQQVDLYRGAGAYLYVHSMVASYTLTFMEALLVGAPIVAPSRAFLASEPYPSWWPERYEIENILSDGVGMVYDSIEEARAIIAGLGERDLGPMSARARARARELFDVRAVAAQWADLLGRLT